jgi:hypothetical protein
MMVCLRVLCWYGGVCVCVGGGSSGRDFACSMTEKGGGVSGVISS